jgi:uncharacterized membrane protein YqjE
MSTVLASGFAVHGAHGVLVLIALFAFAVAAVIAWLVDPRQVWAIFVAGGLAIYMLSLLWT